MSNRAYTVQEIDALRQAVSNKYLYGVYDTSCLGNCYNSRSFDEAEMAKSVEEVVRTHMLAGHTAADLIASESAARGGKG